MPIRSDRSDATRGRRRLEAPNLLLESRPVMNAGPMAPTIRLLLGASHMVLQLEPLPRLFGGCGLMGRNLIYQLGELW